jgi:hopene-associated glycosyltransferase HpnB
MIPLALLTAATWAYLFLAHGRFWQAGPVLPLSFPHRAPPVAIVVPARDEAESIRRAITSLLAQRYAGVFRVIVVNDGSTDGTGEALAAMAEPRLAVVAGAPRPEGWAGKLWAVSQGIAAAEDAEYLLLCDADIEHDPAHLASLLAQAERSGADLVSEMVRLSCESPAERALVPAFVFFFQLLYPFAQVNDIKQKTAAAAGGTMLVRAAALARIGGIESIKGALIDDCALAAALKPHGKIWLGHSALAASIRPYPHAADIWRMVARSAYVQLRYSPWLLLGTIAGMALVWFAPILLAVFTHGAARWLGVAAWLASMAAYLPTLARFHLKPFWALLLPLIAAFYLAATIASAIHHHSGRGVVWKHRAYQGGGA